MHAIQRLFAVGRRSTVKRLPERLGNRSRKRRLVLDDQKRRSRNDFDGGSTKRRRLVDRHHLGAGDRQLDEERRAGSWARHQPDAATVFLNDRVGHGQPKPGALGRLPWW